MSGPAPARVLVAVGDRALEGRITRGLAEAGLEVAGRCLDGPSLLERVSGEEPVDVVLASPALHRLGEETLGALAARGLPVVLLAGPSDDLSRLSRLGLAIPASSPPEALAQAVAQARERGASRPRAARERPPRLTERQPAPLSAASGGRLIAVASGKGAPGATTIAVALAALLSERAPGLVLLDLDLRGGNVAPALDLDPRRGLVGVASPDADVSSELQPGPGFAVLCGVERPELAASISEEAPARAARALRERSSLLVGDLGASVPEGLLRPGDELLVVSGCDLVALWNARTALPALRSRAGGARLRCALNRREGREHYAPREVEAALGVEVAGSVREERESARRAVAGQRPLSSVGGRVASDLRELARALGGPDAVAPEPQLPLAELRLPGLQAGALRW